MSREKKTRLATTTHLTKGSRLGNGATTTDLTKGCTYSVGCEMVLTDDLLIPALLEIDKSGLT